MFNYLVGFWFEIYKVCGWENVLKEFLQINRMKKEILDMMWQVIIENKQLFVQFLNWKVFMFGFEKFSWYDVEVLIGFDGKVYLYDEVVNVIVSQFLMFGKKLFFFIEKVFWDCWIEVEDRSGKRVGGFCMSFLDSGELWIFMMFLGSVLNVLMFVYEFGYVFYQEVMFNVRLLNWFYVMNVVEMVLMFVEMIVVDVIVQQVEMKEEKFVFFEDKV